MRERFVNDPSTATNVADVVAGMTFVIDKGLGTPQLGPLMDIRGCELFSLMTKRLLPLCGIGKDKAAYDKEKQELMRQAQGLYNKKGGQTTFGTTTSITELLKARAEL